MDAWRGFKDDIGMTKKYTFPLGTSLIFRYIFFFFFMERSHKGRKMNTKSM